jgi:hypothetical protein
MADRVVPMIHVPDVRATVKWYEFIGFKVCATYGDDGDGLTFAILSFERSEVMFNSGGHTSTAHRREVELYVYSDSVDDFISVSRIELRLRRGLTTPFTACESSSSATSMGFG